MPWRASSHQALRAGDGVARGFVRRLRRRGLGTASGGRRLQESATTSVEKSPYTAKVHIGRTAVWSRCRMRHLSHAGGTPDPHSVPFRTNAVYPLTYPAPPAKPARTRT